MSWPTSAGGQQGSAPLGALPSNSVNSAPIAVQETSGPNFRWWIPSSGIRRDVIEADVQRYLGPQAVIRPGKGRDEDAGRNGYWIAAYRTFTPEMVRDLKADSANFERSGDQGSYRNSAVHQSRQYWGPTVSESPVSATDRPSREKPTQYNQTSGPGQTSQSSRDPYREQYAQPMQRQSSGYGQESSRPAAGYPERSSSMSSGYTQHLPSGYTQPYDYSQHPPAEAFDQQQGPTGYSQSYGRPSNQQTYPLAQAQIGEQPYASQGYDAQGFYAASGAQQRRDPQAYTQQVYESRGSDSARTAQATHPAASRHARPGYYLASDGNYYPESSRPSAS